MSGTEGTVVAVARDRGHHFSKPTAMFIRIVTGLGVEGDAHAGATVKHRSRVARNPLQPNLRQVHLLQAEVLDELNRNGFPITPGMLGENITTRGIDLLALPQGTRLHVGPTAIVEVTGLRNPCVQIENFHEGLLEAVLEKQPGGRVVRKTGVMSIVVADGEIAPGDTVRVQLPPRPHVPLEVV
ncbi:MAG: MOSC domain-containing protein [Acidobacteria bacterium]|nr:MOSC domain-containing protein [Acidobacteriota bacterium]